MIKVRSMRNWFRLIGIALTLALLLSGCVTQSPGGTGPAPAPQPPKLYAWGAAATSSSYYLQYTVFAQVINKYVKEAEFTVVESGGSEDNIKRLAGGELAAGLVGVEGAYDAYNGLGKYKDAQFKDFRVLMIHNLAPQAWVVTAESGIKTLQDLDGKPFAAGGRGSLTEVLAQLVLDALGIKPKYFVGSNDDLTAALKDGRIVGYVKSQPGPTKADSSTLDIMTAKPLTFLGFTPEQRATIAQKVPVVSGWQTIKAGGWGPNQPELLSYSTTVAVGTTTKLDQDLAYKMLDTLVSKFDEVVAGFPSLQGADIPGLTLGSSVPLHPGTVKWLADKGHKVPEKVIVK